MKLKLLSIFFLSITAFSFAQNKKEIKKNKIKSITEYTSVTENGKEVVYKDYYYMYDKDGKSVEETEFAKNGSIQKKQSTKYDKNDNKVEETNFHNRELKNSEEKSITEPKQNINTRTTNKYNANNDKTEEDTFDVSTGKLLNKQMISYNAKGEKILEEFYDGDDKLIKKTTFVYDNKGLKTEKKIFNAENVLQTTKKYVYEFY
ncbi:MAG: hypothetical protein ACXVPU_01555 [Bacteroidia bacterium]